MSMRSFYKQVMQTLARTAPSFHYRQPAAESYQTQTFIDRPRPIPLLLTGTIAALLATATVVLGVVVYRYAAGEEIWGWNRPGALAEASKLGGKNAYLNQLAVILDEWQQKRHLDKASTSDEVQEGLGELYRACLALLAAKHEPLTKADQNWLQEKCLTWIEQVHNYRIALARGTDPQQVRDTMLSVVGAMIQGAPQPRLPDIAKRDSPFTILINAGNIPVMQLRERSL